MKKIYFCIFKRQPNSIRCCFYRLHSHMEHQVEIWLKIISCIQRIWENSFIPKRSFWFYKKYLLKKAMKFSTFWIAKIKRNFGTYSFIPKMNWLNYCLNNFKIPSVWKSPKSKDNVKLTQKIEPADYTYR